MHQVIDLIDGDLQKHKIHFLIIIFLILIFLNILNPNWDSSECIRSLTQSMAMCRSNQLTAPMKGTGARDELAR